MIHLYISQQTGLPIYLQIVRQIKHLVASGRLAAEDEMPPIRTLAQQLLINPNTVARAYRELEVEGLLTKRQGAGTYVSDGGSPLALRERKRIVAERVDGLLAEARQLDIGVDDVIDLVRRQDEALGKGDEEKQG